MESDNSTEEQSIDPEVTAKKGEGRFRYSELHNYLQSKAFPEGFAKTDKNALRKMSKFFVAQGPDLFYVVWSCPNCTEQ